MLDEPGLLRNATRRWECPTANGLHQVVEWNLLAGGGLWAGYLLRHRVNLRLTRNLLA